MKTITFIRHAKSSHSFDLPDFERPLNERGLSDASKMGQAMKDKFIMPELILSSSAVRAKTTAEIIAKEIHYPTKNICYTEKLYFIDNYSFLTLINETDDTINHLYIVSHNPGITDIVNRISNVNLDYMPTCGMAQIKFDVETWKDITEKSGSLLVFDLPKNKR